MLFRSRLPGLTSMQSSGEPGADQATFYVRGVGTWNDALPLYVIDGVERNAAIFRSMSPEELESVSILKDAAATSVYGSKGANGVILITTKRGSQGAPTINMSAGYTMQQFTRFPKYLDSYNSLVLMNGHAARGMMPAQQRFGLEDVSGGQRHDRLQIHFELTGGNGVAQIVAEH
mgnify:CR=1 FL=1